MIESMLLSISVRLISTVLMFPLVGGYSTADETEDLQSRIPVNGKQLAGVLSGGERSEQWAPKSSNQDLSGDAEKIYQKVAPAVVVVRTGDGHGTGFLISADGWIVTNNHVVNDAITIVNDGPLSGSQIARINLGTLVDGEMKVVENQIPALIYKLDPQKDLALLKLVELPAGVKEVPHLRIAEKKPGPGSSCVAIGHPTSGMLWTLRKGDISSLGTWPKDRIDVMLEYLADTPDQRKQIQQTLASIPSRRVVISTCGINPGDSGGPLVNSNGEVIAVTFAIPKNLSKDGISLDKFSYHVLVEELQDFLKAIPDKPPLHIPEFWPQAVDGRIMDRDSDGKNDTMTFLAGEDVVSGLLVDADQNSGPDFAKELGEGKRSRDSWDAEMMVHPLSGKVFYDKNNDGEFDEIVRDFDGDGFAELVLRKTNGQWVVRKVAKQPSFDFSLFDSPTIANRAKQILAGKGRRDASQPEEPKKTKPSKWKSDTKAKEKERESAKQKKSGINEATKGPNTKVQEAPALKTSSEFLKYVPDDVAIVAAIQPSRLFHAKTLQDAIRLAKGEDVVATALSEDFLEIGLDPTKVIEAGLFVDTKTVAETSTYNAEAIKKVPARNRMKQIGLAMHNFADTHNSFPDDDGIDRSKGNLSWRVHLLPYLDEAPLYREFHLDEPWDSAHNKTLIDKMPDVFKVAGVNGRGKTSIHVLTGEGTPFGLDKPPTLASITDGINNTIMTVVAGTDKADVWTKPGGLELDSRKPLSSLGTVGNEILVGFMDGSVSDLSNKIDPTSFLHLAQHQDGQTVDVPYQYSGPKELIPGIVVRLSEPYDEELLLKRMLRGRKREQKTIAGFSGTDIGGEGYVLFPDAQTMLISSETTLKAMIGKRGAAGVVKKRFTVIYPVNDAAFVSNLELNDEQRLLLFPGTNLPEPLKQILGVEAVVDATGDYDSLLKVNLKAQTPAAAQQINGAVRGGYDALKGQLLNSFSETSERLGLSEQLQNLLGDFLDSVEIEANESTVSIRVQKFEDSEKLTRELMPSLEMLFNQSRDVLKQAREARKLLQIKMIGLAFHNYHDVHGGFPSWNAPNGLPDRQGLGWRVHLLPYLEQSELYSKFHLDEPWDSAHNKALISEMPDVFRSDGVTEDGKTSFHVFLGTDTPIGAGQPRSMAEISDGLSKTLLVVEAGPDTAEYWTKPSGLKYDINAPLKSLGKIGEQIKVVLCDGSAQVLSTRIDGKLLRCLIECQDGEEVSNF